MFLKAHLKQETAEGSATGFLYNYLRSSGTFIKPVWPFRSPVLNRKNGRSPGKPQTQEGLGKGWSAHFQKAVIPLYIRNPSGLPFKMFQHVLDSFSKGNFLSRGIKIFIYRSAIDSSLKSSE